MVITDIKECKRNKNRVNIFAADEFAFACYKDTAVEFGLRKGTELTLELVDELLAQDGKLYAFQTAIKYIAHRPRTKRDVFLNLQQKKIEEEYIESAISQLESYGYVDDTDYAEQYAEELSIKFGEKMVVQKLLQKGIQRSVAESAAAKQDYAASLEEVMAQFMQRYVDDPKDKARQKLVNALLRRGFDYHDIENKMGGFYEE